MVPADGLFVVNVSVSIQAFSENLRTENPFFATAIQLKGSVLRRQEKAGWFLPRIARHGGHISIASEYRSTRNDIPLSLIAPDY